MHTIAYHYVHYTILLHNQGVLQALDLPPGESWAVMNPPQNNMCAITYFLEAFSGSDWYQNQRAEAKVEDESYGSGMIHDLW